MLRQVSLFLGVSACPILVVSVAEPKVRMLFECKKVQVLELQVVLLR